MSPENPGSSETAAPAETGFSIASIKSCDQVEPMVAEYVVGLEPSEGNSVTEWGVSCMWQTAEGETDLANVREVEVLLSQLEDNAEAPDAESIAAALSGTVIEDPWLTENGGVAYSMTLGTAVAGVTVTTIWVPGAEVAITGGQWNGYPSLDGPASVEVAKKLLS